MCDFLDFVSLGDQFDLVKKSGAHHTAPDKEQREPTGYTYIGLLCPIFSVHLC